uniref:Lysozyme n=2 Tax=Talaromyces marneffei PM1 TaxID=1077442 RepID=A0A093VSX0_TALMA
MSWLVWGVAAFAMRSTADSFFLNNTDFTSQAADVSSACATALHADLICDPYLTYVMTSNFYGIVGNSTLHDQFCALSCSSDLAAHKSNVTASCVNDPPPFPGLPATYWADWAISAFDHVCMKDASTGQYCVDVIGGYFQNQTADTDGTELPTDQLCSNCVVSLFQYMQGTSFSNYDASLATVWSTIQSQCSLSYPTAVATLQTNVTQPGGFAVAGYTSSSICLSGKTYNVVSGDNCQAIAEQNSVSTGTLIAINDIYSDCTNIWVGQVLCMPPQCTTYIVQSGDTCDGIAATTNTMFQKLVAWNPALGSYCTNLLSGQNICVSPPGGVQNLTTISGRCDRHTNGYLRQHHHRDSLLCCDRYHGRLRQILSDSGRGLFEAINPSINSTCGNLELGVYYCVLPTQNWNATVTSTMVPPPTTTPSGTTASCYEWYVIQSGDYCALVENRFDITMAQLQAWNFSLLSDCSNLALGEAYCVHGATQPASSPATPTSSGGFAKRRAEMAQPTANFQSGGVPYGWPGLRAPNPARAYAVATQLI